MFFLVNLPRWLTQLEFPNAFMVTKSSVKGGPARSGLRHILSLFPAVHFYVNNQYCLMGIYRNPESAALETLKSVQFKSVNFGFLQCLI